MVHVTPDLVEACDNFRLFRATLPTGFTGEILLPASSLKTLAREDFKQVSLGEGWTHFKTAEGAEVSIRCSHENYHDSLDALLEEDGAEKVSLPANLGEIVSRAKVMQDPETDPQVGVKITPKELVLTSRKDTGWYKEKKRVKYDGPELEFLVNPEFLAEILELTRQVKIIGNQRIKLETDTIQFVAALVQSKDD